jgi:hypothetical protein
MGQPLATEKNRKHLQYLCNFFLRKYTFRNWFNVNNNMRLKECGRDMQAIDMTLRVAWTKKTYIVISIAWQY